jgi:Spy/CpxP family protein refolding chaperone
VHAEEEEIMNRYARQVVTFGSIVGALALVPADAAFAQQVPAAQELPNHAHRAGLLGAALKLDSLTAGQRTAIEGLKAQRDASTAPVRSAHAQVLALLAQEVEQGSVDAQALAPGLNAEHSAAAAESAFEESALTELHALLTPAQRGQLVDSIEAARGQTPQDGQAPQGGDGARHGYGSRGAAWGGKLGLTPEQKSQIAANLAAERSGGVADGGKHTHGASHRQGLEAFRGDSFDASALVRVEHRGEWVEKIAQAMVPVLTPAQRAMWASGLRARAARESHS